jgi:hypothetical protein
LVPGQNYHDWPSIELGLDFCRYYNGRVWRKAPIWEYEPRNKGRKPFAFLEPAALSFRLVSDREAAMRRDKRAEYEAPHLDHSLGGH